MDLNKQVTYVSKFRHMYDSAQLSCILDSIVVYSFYDMCEHSTATVYVQHEAVYLMSMCIA